jgi:hypothetical protein
MNPNQEKQQHEDNNSPNMRRIRRGPPNRGRATMPEPDNVVPTITASTPTFRYVQNW